MSNVTNGTLPKLCYCQSARHARATVKALEAAGFSARADAVGNIFSTGGDAAWLIAQGVKVAK